jgi:prophage antirepressor-like protein
MKLYITTVLLALNLCYISNAQLKETVLKTVHDNGKTMQLKIQVALHDASINYDQTFDVTNMNKEQKGNLINHVIDSLGASKYFKSEPKSSTDKQQIERAILNYVEGVYEADTAKIYESVSPFLAKRGYYLRDNQLREATMTFDQLVALTKRWNQNQEITAATPKKITVFDILDKTASAKVEAKWGIDYFHLAKINGKWTIVNVLWQDYPVKN